MAQTQNVAIPVPGPGILMFAVGVFAAWLFATGRLDAVRQAIASGAAPASGGDAVAAATGQAANNNTGPLSLSAIAVPAATTLKLPYASGNLPGVTLTPSANGVAATAPATSGS